MNRQFECPAARNARPLNLATWPSGDAAVAALYLLRVVSEMKADEDRACGFGNEPSRDAWSTREQPGETEVARTNCC
jgi:hypothetical protein